MVDFKYKIAVITGAGTGMGRALARQLAAEGCHVAICDIIVESMLETKTLCEAAAQPGTRVTAHECDVADNDQVIAFRDAVKEQHGADHIHLLFNNAGIGGGHSFVLDDQAQWDRVFAINWNGVYNCARAFLPMLVASTEGWIVNTSSVCGFWACLGPQRPHSAYSASKFAVKGFTEGLRIDLRCNAPHVKAVLVMPGHVGTSINENSTTILGGPAPADLPPERLAAYREWLESEGVRTESMDDRQLVADIERKMADWRDKAPVTPAQAAEIILDGVRNDQWRILVGKDAVALDRLARAEPEKLYDCSPEEFGAQLAGTTAPDSPDP